MNVESFLRWAVFYVVTYGQHQRQLLRLRLTLLAAAENLFVDIVHVRGIPYTAATMLVSVNARLTQNAPRTISTAPPIPVRTPPLALDSDERHVAR